LRLLATVGGVLAVLALLAALSWFSLSERASGIRSRCRQAGVTTRVVDVPAGRKVVGVAWQGDTLWVLTRPAAAGESPDEGWSLREEPSWGWRNEVLLRPQGGR
jgi:hypothetical protein